MEYLEKLSKFLDDNALNPSSLAHQWGIAPAAMYNIVKGKTRPRRFTALKIIKGTNGLLTLEDFGFK